MRIHDTFFREILDSLPQPTAFLGPDYCYRYFNEAYCRFFGKIDATCTGQTVSSVYGAKTFQDILKGYIDECLQGKAVALTHLLDFGSSRHTLHISYHPHYESEAWPGGVIETFRELSSESVLRQNWYEMVNAMDEALLIINRNFIIEDLNAKARQLLNKPREAIIGQKCHKILHESDEPVADCPVSKSLETGKTESFTFFNERQQRWISVRTTPIFNAHNEIEKFVEVIHDVTEQKQAEKGLRENEQFFRQIGDNVIDTLYVFDPEKKRFLYASKGYERMLERPLEELYANPKSFLPLVHPDDVNGLLAAAKNEMEASQFLDHEFRIMLPDGRVRWIHARNFPVYNENQKQYRTVGIAEDITKMKQAEQRIKAANAAKDRLFSILGHDLLTPMATLKEFIELLERNYIQYPEEKRRKYLGLINESASSLISLLGNLMTWSRSQQQKIEVHPQPLHIHALTAECFAVLKPSASRKQIRLFNQVPQDAAGYADKAMMTIVLRNLISNGIKFTPHGGKVEVFARREAARLVIGVADTGMGIEADKTAKLFIFAEIYSTPGTDGEKGTGLGLVICKEFVEQNAGEIWVKTTPKSGTIFYFSVPLHKQTAYER